MLLDIEFTIKVTNDGDRNNAKLYINQNDKVVELITALFMAQEYVTNLVTNHLSKNYGDIPEDQVESIVAGLTFREVPSLDLDLDLDAVFQRGITTEN